MEIFVLVLIFVTGLWTYSSYKENDKVWLFLSATCFVVNVFHFGALIGVK